jgi:hypothetical protein
MPKKKGGARAGAGRKKKITTEIQASLRDRITFADVDYALATLRYAMKQKKENLRTAVEAAEFLIEQKGGKAPQSVDLTTKGQAISVNLVYRKK